MTIDFLLGLLNEVPGNILYHLVVVLGLFAGAGIVWAEWRHAHTPDIKPYLIALPGTIGLHLWVTLLVPLYADTPSRFALLMAPWLYAGDTLAVLLLVWAFGWQLWQERSRVIIRGILLVWGGALIITSLAWMMAAPSQSVMEHYVSFGWQVSLWYGLMAIPALGAAVYFYRRQEHSVYVPVAFLAIGVGAVVSALGAPGFPITLLSGEGLGRLITIFGYPLLTVALYNAVLQDLTGYRQELRKLSHESLRQSQELLFLVEATRSIGETEDLQGMLEHVVNNVVMALQADTMAIFLTNADDAGALDMVALYQVLGNTTQLPRRVEMQELPSLQYALLGKQLIFGARKDFTPLRPLYDLMGVQGAGPVLIQPLTRQERTLGLFVVCNDSSQAPFSPEQERLAHTVAVQIAGAVENFQLYARLAVKAKELEDLLRIREAELRREDAIVESMAEGILVSDAQGRFILLNEAAEDILQVQREHIVGLSIQELDEYPVLRSEFAPGLLIGLAHPLETTFDFNERKIRSHSAPVLMEDGARLGVVSILQDITREFLAEQSKREFIASISHELRTPLTAIKGYTEVMLSGMAGELPAAFTQFLGVIRENTTRMAALTNNIISVAEIEQGRVGLNYQQVNVPAIADEVVNLYRGRIHERNLELKVDFPTNAPSVEADPNRLRLILDNLLSNAIRFTYSEGRVIIGGRVIQGPVGEPTFFSIWVSDSGVGIPLDEQPRIWERFYRVDNPLSLEARGLGIGLTITKAMVEAHRGRVWVDSTIGRGSTFTVLLPIKSPEDISMPVEGSGV